LRIAKDFAEHVSRLTRLEVELKTLEVKNKARALGAGAGVGVAAGIFAALALCFAVATAAAALATAMPVWLALLIITGVLLLLAGITGLIAVRLVRRVTH
jgi:predicted phage tail protein